MPELPEVETMRRGIAAIAGSTIAGARKASLQGRPILIQPRPATLAELAGQRIDEVGRLGKRVVLRLESGDRLIFEPRMTGLVLVADPPTQEHLRFRLDLADGPIPHVWYWDRRGLGSRAAAREQQFAEQLGRRQARPRRARRSRPTSCASGWHRAAARSRSPCSTSGRSPASAISTPPRFCTWPACIRRSAATCSTAEQWQAIHARMLRGAAAGDPLRRLDALRRHVSQRPEPVRRLSEPPPRL